MLVRELREAPDTWGEHWRSIRSKKTVPFHAIDWIFQWLAYYLSHWAFLEVLEYLGALSVLFGVIFYYSESGDRRKQRHYQAWQVVNSALGQHGSGGRIEALQELNADSIPLTGVDVSGAFLQGIQLHKALLARADLEAVDMRDSNLTGSDLSFAELKSANLRKANLRDVNLRDADLEDVDLVGASLRGAALGEANLKDADLRDCDLSGMKWRDIKTIEAANVHGVRNAPPGFLDWAMSHGAVSIEVAEE